MRARDDVHRQRAAHGAADGEPEPALARRDGDERRREHRPGPGLEVAEERPRPLPRPDVRRRRVEQLAARVAPLRGHQVEEAAGLPRRAAPSRDRGAEPAPDAPRRSRSRSGCRTRRDAPHRAAARSAGSPRAGHASPGDADTRRCSGQSARRTSVQLYHRPGRLRRQFGVGLPDRRSRNQYEISEWTL